MIAVHRGDVWWAEIPGDRRRPVVVLTRERFIASLDSVIVAPVTTRVRGIPTEVGLDETDGLPRRCAANFDNVFTLRRGRRTKSRDFYDLIAEMHVREAKAPADEAAIAKQAPDLFRQGIGRHIEILRRNAEEQIAHRTAYQKPLVSRLF